MKEPTKTSKYYRPLPSPQTPSLFHANRQAGLASAHTEELPLIYQGSPPQDQKHEKKGPIAKHHGLCTAVFLIPRPINHSSTDDHPAEHLPRVSSASPLPIPRFSCVITL